MAKTGVMVPAFTEADARELVENAKPYGSASITVALPPYIKGSRFMILTNKTEAAVQSVMHKVNGPPA